MLEKIKNCVWRFLGIVWVSCMCTFLAGPRDLGGAEINGFFAFLIWLVLLVVIVKGHIVAACIISTIEQNRCAMACQGCGAVLFLLKKQWNYFP